MKTTTLEARAKLNLSLRITGRLSNGYHTLETVMAPLALSDTVTLQCDETPLKPHQTTEITCKTQWSEDILSELGPTYGSDVPQGETNLAWKAARTYLDNFTYLGASSNPVRPSRIIISITKRIPMGGGMGGGSTDAAAVLCGLHQLLGSQTSEAQAALAELGLKLGADVPFLMKQQPAFCTGLGEVMSAVPWAKQWHGTPVLLLHPGFPVPTPWAYRAWDQHLESMPQPPKVTSLWNPNDLSQVLYNSTNDFESVVFPQHKTMQRIISCMHELGATAARMTGSGSTLFALAKSALDLENMELTLRRTFTSEIRNGGWYLKRTTGCGI